MPLGGRLHKPVGFGLRALFLRIRRIGGSFTGLQMMLYPKLSTMVRVFRLSRNMDSQWTVL
jgi:hypothetical protein